MKFKKPLKWIGIFISIPHLIFSFAKEGEELQILDRLIASTERQLSIHRELRTLITDFYQQQELFHQGEQTKELTGQMVQTASKILELVQDRKLTYLPTPFFIEELQFFSAIDKKTHPTL